MPTIDDVSRLANVSRATVSRVLTGTRGVREESREAVLRAVEELNYRPSFAAQNLASQTSSHVGLVISAQDESHGARLLPLLSQALRDVLSGKKDGDPVAVEGTLRSSRGSGVNYVRCSAIE